jgi:adenylate cyclase
MIEPKVGDESPQMSTTPGITSEDPEQTIAGLRRERDEALARESALAEVLQVINSAPGDLGPVFEAILEKAKRLCEADGATFWVFDGERFYPKVSFNSAAREIVGGWRPGPNVALGRLMAGEKIVHTVDASADPGYQSDATALRIVTGAGGARSLLAVALRQDDHLLGAITTGRRTVRPYSDKQIALLQSFAAQAVIAMENARFITETREALEQQTATAEVLQVINASPGDLRPVFDAMLEKAVHLCDAAHGELHTYDGQRFHTVAFYGVSAEYIELRIKTPPLGRPGTGTGRLLETKRPLHVLDAAAGESYLRGEPSSRLVVDVAGVRTSLSMPLLKDDIVLGNFLIYRREVRPFTDKQIALLGNFAAQAVIAMENARLIMETREALEQQTATAELLGVINSSPGNLTPVFDAILEKAHSLCGAVHGVLMVREGETGRAVAARGLPEAFETLLRTEFPVVGNPVGEPLLSGAPFVQIADLSGVDHPLAQAATAAGLRTLVAVALRKEGTLLGWIAAARPEVRLFSDKDVALLQNFAAQAVIAMENARLLGELRQRTEEVAELNRGLEVRVAEQVEELGRVGRLKRFLAPQLAELIVSHGDENILESHRREIVVVFCDLRGYTAFTETAEPEEVLDFLREYHGALGPLVSQFEGTLDQFSGDGIMVFFNDPVPCPDPAERAVKMAMAMREAAGKLIATWRRRRGRVLGFGVGIAQGYATLGQIGFAERSGYTAIGTVCNLAARLCAEAKDGQILLAQRVAVAVEETTPLEEVGQLTLKGLTQPVVAYNVPLAASQPALRVIEGGPPDENEATAPGAVRRNE